jgi:hypothetical protein
MSLLLLIQCRGAVGSAVWRAELVSATRMGLPSQTGHQPFLMRRLNRLSTSSDGRNASKMSDAQRRSYEYYERKRMESPIYRFKVWWNRNKEKKSMAGASSTQDLNVKLAWYAAAIVVGVVGATYASVPLYKVFCQTTGFGGTSKFVLCLPTSLVLKFVPHL